MKSSAFILLLIWSCAVCPSKPSPRDTNSTEGSCEGRPLDLVFVIDSSRSVRPEDYERVKTFIKDLLLFLNVGHNQTHVGLVQFGSVVQNEFFLNSYFEKQLMLSAVERMEHLASGTMTGLALQFTREEAFSPARGARPVHMQVPRVAVVVTDGRPQDSVEGEADRARRAGIEIFAVGVGRVDLVTLQAIGSEPHAEHVHLVASFSQIETLLSVFHSKLCAGSDPCASGIHECEHECVNTDDSFKCRCREGFTLAPDGKACGLDCKRGSVDLMFVISGSRHLGITGFDLLKRFVSRTVSALPAGTRVGLLQYSSKVRSEFTLGQYSSASELQRAIAAVRYMGRGSVIGAALQYLIQNSFRNSSRTAQRVAVVFTDGRSQDNVHKWASKVKAFRNFKSIELTASQNDSQFRSARNTTLLTPAGQTCENATKTHTKTCENNFYKTKCFLKILILNVIKIIKCHYMRSVCSLYVFLIIIVNLQACFVCFMESKPVRDY